MKVKLRDILTPVSRAEPVESEKKYIILGVKWYAKGAWVKDEKYGADIKANSAYRVQEGDLIYNRLFAWKGSFAVISKDLDGNYVSNEFPALRCNEKMAYLDYVFLFLSQYDVWAAIDKLSTGVASISRKRLKVQDLLNIEILLPPKNIQQKIINKYSHIDSFYSQLIKQQDKNAVFVKKLRQAILQLAMQGKLAPQDPNDEPASELLKRIKAEKEKLITEGKIKKQKPLPPITEDEITYELPQGWEWVRMKKIAYNIGQKKPDKRFTYIDVTAINKEKGTISNQVKILEPSEAPSRARKIVQKETVIYSTVRPYLLNVAIVDKEFEPEPIVSTAFAILNPYKNIYNKYLYYFLRSKIMIDYVESKMIGMAYPAINDTQFLKAPFPLPPLAEQKRIVAKVDQLVYLCDELGTRLSQSKKDSEMLMQAVLHEAFS